MVESPSWVDWWRLALYGVQLVIFLLVAKLLTGRRPDGRLRLLHPLAGNTPMYLALLALLIGSMLNRIRNLGAPPGWPTLLTTTIATLLIVVWLYRNLELRAGWFPPQWARRKRRRQRRREYERDAARRRPGDARA